MKSYKTVDAFIEGEETWQPELIRLREILVSCGLEETIKWGRPAYLHQSKSVVGLASFKSYFGLWFFQGALLKDEANVLMNAQDGKTKAMRQWRMSHAREIKVRTIRAYVKESVALQDAGLGIKADRSKPVVIPIELKEGLNKNPKAKALFAKLTKGRKREFAEHVAEAKQEATRLRRVKKIIPMIESGIGMNDKYRR